MYLFCHVILQDRDQGISWLYGRKLFIVWSHSGKFGGYKNFGSGDIKFLIYHVFKGLYDLMGGNFSL